MASVQTMLGGDAPGEVDGHLVPAEMIRQLVSGLAGLPPVATPAGAADADTATATAIDGAVTDHGTTIDAATCDVPAAAADAAGSTTAAPAALVGREPFDTESDLIERAAAELDSEAFDRWFEELVRQAFGDAPAPGDPGWSPGVPPGLTEGDPGPWPDLENRHDASDLPGPEPDDFLPRGAPAAAPGGGWWATADRAVDDASTAVHTARLALSAAQRMVATAQRADAADEATWQASAAGRVTAAPDAVSALAEAADTQREQLAELLVATAGGGLADRPRLALTDAVTGALLALTDLPALRRAGTCGAAACRRRPEACDHDLTGRPGLGPPGPTAGYRPAAELDRFVRARDRRCRFPGCRRRIPRAGELDHIRPHPEGPTSAANLAGFCTTDHRGKHQAPGWTHRLDPDGTLTVTTPTGLTAVTTPPPY